MRPKPLSAQRVLRGRTRVWRFRFRHRSHPTSISSSSCRLARPPLAGQRACHEGNASPPRSEGAGREVGGATGGVVVSRIGEISLVAIGINEEGERRVDEVGGG